MVIAFLLPAPPVRKLIEITSFRAVTVIGAWGMTAGFIILAFAGNIEIVYLAFSISGN